VDLQDLLGGLVRDLLDVHAALGGGDDRDAALLAVDQDGQVELAGDVEALLDVQPPDLLPLGAGLLGDELHPQHLLGDLGRLRGAALRHLDAAALAATAGVDLRLHHHDRVPGLCDEALGDRADLTGAERGLPLWHRHAVAREDLLALILVDFHERGTDATTMEARANGQR
jgi:hypothetical protein